MVEERFAQTDYQLKLHARSLLDFLAGVQEVRKGVRESRRKSGS